MRVTEAEVQRDRDRESHASDRESHATGVLRTARELCTIWEPNPYTNPNPNPSFKPTSRMLYTIRENRALRDHGAGCSTS